MAKKRKLNDYFKKMLAAKRKGASSFTHNGKTYKKVKLKTGIISYKKAQMKVFGDKVNWGTVAVAVGVFIAIEMLAEIYVFRPGVKKIVDEELRNHEII